MLGPWAPTGRSLFARETQFPHLSLGTVTAQGHLQVFLSVNIDSIHLGVVGSEPQLRGWCQ